MRTVDRARCELCGACAGVCPVLAIVIRGNGVFIDTERCTGCGNCETVCPVEAVTSGGA